MKQPSRLIATRRLKSGELPELLRWAGSLQGATPSRSPAPLGDTLQSAQRQWRQLRSARAHGRQDPEHRALSLALLHPFLDFLLAEAKRSGADGRDGRHGGTGDTKER